MIRVYLAIHADVAVTPSEEQWQELVAAAKNKPLATAIRQAARKAQHYIQADKRSYGTGEVRRWTMAGFEIDGDSVSDIRAVVNAQAAVHGCVGTLAERFICVLQAELQEAATDLGYGAQAANLTIPWYAYGARGEAISTAQQYIADHDAVWHDYA